MAIENTFVHFNNKEDFENSLEKGDIKDTSIIFIKDSKEIYTHGEYYKGGITWKKLESTSEPHSGYKVTTPKGTVFLKINNIYKDIYGEELFNQFIEVLPEKFEASYNYREDCFSYITKGNGAALEENIQNSQNTIGRIVGYLASAKTITLQDIEDNDILKNWVKSLKRAFPERGYFMLYYDSNPQDSTFYWSSTDYNGLMGELNDEIQNCYDYLKYLKTIAPNEYYINGSINLILFGNLFESLTEEEFDIVYDTKITPDQTYTFEKYKE